MTFHLAIDIGASSGRHIVGYLENGLLVTKEVYRFTNGMKNSDGALIWDIQALFDEVLNGLAACREQGFVPSTVAVDTWGVDYVLLDAEGNEILPVFAYRDGGTARVLDEVADIVSREELYGRTGIQHQDFNTLYRLFVDKKLGRLEGASAMLMMPEYINYKLTGVICAEYTNASTTGLLNAVSKEWDFDTIDRLGLPSRLFGELHQPCHEVGFFTEAVAQRLGYNARVLLCPSHDTASAVAACPMDRDGVYISSGTWSLVGAENTVPVLSEKAKEANFTNEGGICGTYRFLKNIMGMWLFQGIRKSIGAEYGYDDMMRLGMSSEHGGIFDPNAKELVAPEDMLTALRHLLGDEDMPLGMVLASVYHSLALSYAEAIKEIEALSEREFSAVHIIGGGSRDGYLNALSAKYTGKKVFAGPTEATAVGNLISQIMSTDSNISIYDARELVKASFGVTEVLGV